MFHVYRRAWLSSSCRVSFIDITVVFVIVSILISTCYDVPISRVLTSGRGNLRFTQTWCHLRMEGCGSRLIHASLAHLNPWPKRHLDRFSRFCTARGRGNWTTRGTPTRWLDISRTGQLAV